MKDFVLFGAVGLNGLIALVVFFGVLRFVSKFKVLKLFTSRSERYRTTGGNLVLMEASYRIVFSFIAAAVTMLPSVMLLNSQFGVERMTGAQQETHAERTETDGFGDSVKLDIPDVVMPPNVETNAQ